MGGHIHLDPVGGIAGDMFVAALLDTFPEFCAQVFADVSAVLPTGVRAGVGAASSNGIAAKRFMVGGDPEETSPSSYSALKARIEAAALSSGTAARAGDILRRLAESEAHVHQCALESVHFHEIGDWDSLADVVAAGSIAAALSGWSWSVSPLPLGGGIVPSRHGPLPVPAPATAELLKGFEFRDDGIGGERVTPTGAAILAHLCPVPRQSGRLSAVGTGAGTRTLPHTANVLRALAFSPAEDLPQGEQIATIAFAVDDMTGEEIALAADRLRLADGVRDVSVTSRSGKKGRPEQAFELLVAPQAALMIADLCFEETATLGLRLRNETRLVLPRSSRTVTASGRKVRVKEASRPNGSTTAKAESDDLAVLDGLPARRRLKNEVEGGAR
ncbi:MAG: LarC family nickel insertion protein [Pseudomonadota bacterium]